MPDRAKVHRDGRGATFVGAGGYTAYRLLRVAAGVIHKDVRWAVVKERHQRHESTQELMMPIRQWEELLAEAKQSQSIADGGRP